MPPRPGAPRLVRVAASGRAGGGVGVPVFSPPRPGAPRLVRVAEGRRGQVPMALELVVRFDYGSVVPWVERDARGLSAVAGPDTVRLTGGVPLEGDGFGVGARFTLAEGQREAFVLTWHPSDGAEPEEVDPGRALGETGRWWGGWSAPCPFPGEWAGPVRRSLLTLKALTYAPPGGIVAAPTPSLPVRLGGNRNWDYRYCWL